MAVNIQMNCNDHPVQSASDSTDRTEGLLPDLTIVSPDRDLPTLAGWKWLDTLRYVIPEGFKSMYRILTETGFVEPGRNGYKNGSSIRSKLEP
ncbi:hypothetical protein CISG_07735 [Coccidioides immitis RMSCC 3703]|uniref:Uncharacterized protein n=1 Tax=Coccidioides immitis RMSCC 3703 TaxID=454286 RepID=A0A0J8R2C7_COCIT|nr:hypothetical protein CISG_07735 [Coccidioides immitis RMSCC 3703]